MEEKNRQVHAIYVSRKKHRNIGFPEKLKFVRRKLVKIAKNSDHHNIDSRRMDRKLQVSIQSVSPAKCEEARLRLYPLSKACI
jgi:hypothetical protein